MHKIQINKFENYCQEQLGLSIHSLRAYRQDLTTFVRFLKKNKIKDVPSGEDIIDYQRELRQVGKSSPATIRRRLITLRSYYGWLQEVDSSVISPFVGLRLEMKVPKRLPKPIDRPTLGSIFQSTRPVTQTTTNLNQATHIDFSADVITALIAKLLVVTGLRIGEITSLKVKDVSGAATKIRVRGKGDRERTVYVANDRLQTDFRCYWENRRDSAGPYGWLFINSRGSHLTPQTYRKRLRDLSRSLRIEPHLTPHRFRHSAATLLIEEGVDIRLVQRLLGHASIATTELYTKVSDNSLVSAITTADTLSKVDFY